MPRSIDEIEKAFREMGLSEATWGQQKSAEEPAEPGSSNREQLFIRIETTTTPLEPKDRADVA